MRLRTRYTHRLPTALGLRLDIPMFEGSGTKVLDVSGKGNHGNIHDAVWTRGENGIALILNGTSAYVDCGNDLSLNIKKEIAIEAWVKANTIQPENNARIVTKLESGGSYVLNLDRGNPQILLLGLTQDRLKDGTTDLRDNQWHHFVGNYDGVDTIKIYIDGVETASRSDTSGNMTSNASKVYFGWDGSGTDYFNGAIDVRIYADGQTAEQIKRRYEQTERDYVRGS